MGCGRRYSERVAPYEIEEQFETHRDGMGWDGMGSEDTETIDVWLYMFECVRMYVCVCVCVSSAKGENSCQFVFCLVAFNFNLIL